MVMLQKSSRYVLPFLELGTLMALFLIILWASGALLEEWGVLNAFNTQGIGYYESFFPLIVLRPLHLGSGLIIPNEVKTGYTEDMEVSHAYPVLPFRKPDGTDQPFLSPLSRYPPCR